MAIGGTFKNLPDKVIVQNLQPCNLLAVLASICNAVCALIVGLNSLFREELLSWSIE